MKLVVSDQLKPLHGLNKSMIKLFSIDVSEKEVGKRKKKDQLRCNI